MKNKKGNEKTAINGKRFLIVLISALIAVALCVTCALVVDTSKPVDVANGAGGEVTTSTAHTNKTGDLTGVINNNDTITWTGVTNYSFYLPAGTYYLEVWGAQGASTTGKTGGKGAYVHGNLTITARTLMYVFVGGMGSGTSGGYNGGGGGGAGRKSNSGGGGGGATDFRRGGNALSNRIVVAGGGGGAGGAGQGGSGSGSISSGSGGTPGYGGAGAGSAGANGTAGGSANGGGGGGAQTSRGGTGGSTNNSSSSGNDGTYYPAGGGGGGGGYYGGGGGAGGSRYGANNNVRGSSGGSGGTGSGGSGGAGASAARGYYSGAGGGGGGGSSYYGGLTSDSSRGWSANSRQGSGMARITVKSVNQAPLQGPNSSTTVYGTTSKARMRSGAGITIRPTTIARDPEGQTMYFTDGTASNLDACTSGQTGLWLNSACTTLATNYITWSRTSSAISITAIHRYPRAGVDNAPANGKLRLWTRVRDTYGSSTSRGWSTVYFDLNVSQSDLTIINTSNNTSGTDVTNKGTYVEYTYGSGNNAYHYRLGSSDMTSTTYDYLTNGHIYNTAKGRSTVFVPEPLTTNRTAGFTINATDLYRDADTVHDVVGIKSVATDSTNSKYYTISYNADSTTYGSSGLYKSITIKPTSVRPPNAVYVTVQITAQSCEKNGSTTGNGSKAVIGGTNTSLWLVFKIANTRPYYASSSVINTGIANEPSAIMNVGTTKEISISSFLKDTDGNVPTFVTSAGSVKLPTNEFASVSRENAVLALKSTSNYYANHAKTVSTSWQTGEGSVATGFAGKDRVIAQAGSAAAATACVTYSFPNSSTIRFTARAATQYLYNTDNRTGDFYVLVKILDPGDSGDTGIWYPIAIKVNSSTPTAPATTANFTLGFTSSGDEATPQGQAINISPVSYTENGTLYGVGAPASGSATDAGMQAYPFVTDADIFSYNNGLTNQSYTSELNEIVMLDTGDNTENSEAGKAARAAAALTLYGTEPFFKVEIIDLWARKEVFNNLDTAQLNALHITNDGQDTKRFYGLRITPLRSTSNYYFRIDVKVVDSHGTKSTVSIEINVENNAISLRRDRSEYSDTRFQFNKTDYGSYVSRESSSTGDAYIVYTIQQGDQLYLTPYDFAYDFDMPAGLNENGAFNTNPSNTGYSAASTAITKTYRVKRTASPTAGGSALAETEVTLQPLTFANESSVISSAGAYSTYFSTEVTRDDAAAGVHSIRITANSRTSSTNIIRFTLTDGFSSVSFAAVIKVSNTAPKLQRNTDILTLAASDVRYNNDIMPSTRAITLDGYVVDINNDTGMFFEAGSARIVAYDASAVGDEADKYFTSLNYDATGRKYVGANDGQYTLSDYVGVEILRIGGIDQIRVTAKSSTQLFDLPLYVEFTVNDDYREQPGVATLRIRVQVLNSDPRLVTDELAEEQFTPAGSTEKQTRYVWDIKYNNVAEKSLTRYLVNSRELYESSAIQGLQSNKLLLFDEADGKQYTLLNTYNTELSGTFVNNLAVRYSAGGTTVTPDAGEYIPADAFQLSSYQNAAVLYTRTYQNSSQVGTIDDDRRDLDIRVIYYEYTGSGANRRLAEVTDKTKVTEYWAIAIKDRSNSSTEIGVPTQVAIAVKDNHYTPTGAAEANSIPVYTAKVADGAIVTENGVCNTSNLTVLNFYLRNQAPGLMDMHKQYRTDGNSESQTPVSEGSSNYTVELDNLYAYQFANKEKPSSQSALSSAAFSDDFRYQYYVNVKEAAGADDTATLVPKAYPGDEGSAFHYKAIEVPASGTVNMPISYIAMPNGYSSSTGTVGTGIHVTFANAGGSNSALKDSDYLNWKNSSAAVALIMENVSLSDGTTSWSGSDINDNPYIQIGFTSDDDMLSGKYVNRYRGVLSSDNQFALDDKWLNGNVSSFREDKFGFTFVKRSDNKAERPSGSLKFTVKLKTFGSSGTDTVNSASQDVSVDIEVENSELSSIKYNNTDFPIYASIDIKTHVGAADTTIGLSRDGGRNNIQYSDSDTNDVARFFMPSATSGNIGAVMSTAEMTAMMGNYLYGGSYSAFFDNPSSNLSLEQVAAFVPNPDYTKYFAVTPSNGSSSSVTFKPVAKTQLNITGDISDDELWNNHHLKRNTNGEFYYPFKIVFYDDINQSGSFTRGKYMTVIFNVYIDNSPISSSLDEKEGNYFKTSLTLVKGAANTVDVSTVLTDSDIPLNASKSMIVQSEWSLLSATDKLTKDYLVMPAKGDGSPDYERYGTTAQSALPIDITYAENSHTTIKFAATSAFTTPSTGVPLLFKFRDSVGTEVGILFYINYVNEAPTFNDDTYGGARTLNIFMKTGDYFTIYASDASKYATDRRGEFKSPDEFDRLIAATGSDKISYPQADGSYVNAETMRDSFELLTRDGYDARVAELNRVNGIIGNLGSLVLGDDDAPSTLRFIAPRISGGVTVGSFSGTGAFDVVPGNFVASEDALKSVSGGTRLTQPMSVTITARGVGTSVYTATLTDGSNQVDVVLNLTVLSTPPSIKTTGLPDGLTVSSDPDFDYEITLDYGAHKEFALSSFVEDADRNDYRTFDIADSYDGEKFKVINPEGVSAVSVTRTQIENGATNAFYIEAVDYIPEEGLYSEVYFRVTDAHDSQSDEIRIKVNIAPRALEVKSGTSSAAFAITLDSYADYLANGNALTVDLVSGSASGSKVYYDPDVNAPSAMYDVAVYAMYAFSEGNRTPATVEDILSSEDYLVVERTQARRGIEGSNATTKPGSNSVAKYIKHFFEITIADDGKTMTLIPVSSTVSGGTSRLPEALNLYIVVGKAYKTENGYTMSAIGGTAVGSDHTVGAYVNVAVANSAPVAVQSTALNFGYPQVGEGENATSRDSDFLFFAGSAGDSLTWNLYDTANEQRGLFYDYDMCNYNKASNGENADANLPAGNETLTYAGSSILASYVYTDSNGDSVSISTTRDAIDGGSHGPVLSITETNGKVTIKINRKVAITQPSEDNRILPYSDIPVEISCIDTLGRRQDNQTNYVRKTVIIVRAQNDPPEFKEVTRNDYRISYSDETGYVLTASVATGNTLTVKFADILDDADVDMDAYFLYAPDSSCIKENTTTLGAGTVPLFDLAQKNERNAFGIITLSRLEFTCTSVARGEVATGSLMLYDSTKLDNAHTSKLTIRLTVGNTAPTAISRDPVVINVMGIPIVESDSEDESSALDSVALTENIIKYMTDINPNDAVNAAEYNAGKDVTDPTRSNTYMYIKDIEVYTTDADMSDLRPEMFGPGTELKEPEEGEDPPAPIVKVCDVGWADSDFETHQSFSVMLTPGVYGTQHIRLYVRDDGYLDGAMNMINDGIETPLDITIIVSRPIADMDIKTFSMANRVTRTMTAEILLNSEEQPDNARGYTVKSITAPEGGALTVSSSSAVQASAYDVSASADEIEWRVTANYETDVAEMTVVFDAGNIDVEQKFNVVVTRNNAPVMKPIDSMGIFTEGQLNDQHMIVIRPDRWFEDPDLGDVMRFNDAKVKVGAYATAHIENGNIVLIFKGRGTTQLTFNITDATGNLYSHTIEIGCTDMAELSTWNKMVAAIQSNVLMYSLIFAGVLLLIILLIIILVIVHKRRKMRREIEALLDSEAELEEEMLRLSAGGGTPQFQSFGYLPPTTQTMNNPNLMIGSAADNPTPNSLQLGAGTGQTAGVAPDGGAAQQPTPQQSRPGMPQQPRQSMGAQPGQPAFRQSQPGMPQQPQQPRQNVGAPNGQPAFRQSQPGMPQNTANPFRPNQPGSPQQQPRQNQGAPNGQPQNRDGFNPNDF